MANNTNDTNKTFLRAVDLSIVDDCMQTAKVKKKIACKKLNYDSYQEITENEAKSYEVFLRIKPGARNADFCRVEDNFTFTFKIGSCWKQYSFDSIFDEKTTQLDMFNACVKANMLNFINGRNVTIMSYGASGSGKTHTIMGDCYEPGLIPRAITYLFKTIPPSDYFPALKPFDGNIVPMDDDMFTMEVEKTAKLLNRLTPSERSTYKKTFENMETKMRNQSSAYFQAVAESEMVFAVWISFMEIYNDNIYDLLVTPTLNNSKSRLKIGTDNSGKTHVKGLSYFLVTSSLEAYKVLQYGINNLKYASTNVNDRSSRSHSMFIISLLQCNRETTKYQISQFTFCDLAGSERSKQTLNVGMRLKESNNINSSLHVLNRCLRAIIEKQENPESKTIIPFRESKLTQFFKHALTGEETLKMIVNVNLNNESIDLNQHVLNFAAIAKNILVIPQETKKPNSRFTMYINRDSRLVPLDDIPLPTNSQVSNDSLFDELESLREFYRNQPILMEMYKRKISDEAYESYKKLMETHQKFLMDTMAKREAELKREHDSEVRHLKKLLRQKPATKLNESGSDVEEDIAANYEYLRQKFEQVRAEKTALECRLNDMINSRLPRDTIPEDIDERLKNQQALIDDAEKDYLELQSNFSDLQKHYEQASVKIVHLEDELGEVKDELLTLREENRCLKEKLEHFESFKN